MATPPLPKGIEVYDVVSFERERLPQFLRERGHADDLKRMILEVERYDQEVLREPRHIFKCYFMPSPKECYELAMEQEYVDRSRPSAKRSTRPSEDWLTIPSWGQATSCRPSSSAAS